MTRVAPPGLNGQDDRPTETIDRPKGAEIRKVIVNEFMSLDGVVQAPGGAEEEQVIAEPLELLHERRFGNGTVYVRYRARK
jgi:hypothetical protein